MKKLLALLLALSMVFAFAACEDKEEEKDETKGEKAEETAMTFEEFMDAEMETKVEVLCAVQATQSWWDNKITVYAADKDGGYFLYEMACSEEDAGKLTPGTWIRVTGTKIAWEGQVEISEATFEFVEKESYIAAATDVTALLGTDELEEKMTLPVLFKGMTVDAVEFKNGESGDDIYVTLSKDGTAYSFCVERYLTGPDTDVYQAVSALEVGAVVDVQAYLYWYQGPNPHITSVTAA